MDMQGSRMPLNGVILPLQFDTVQVDFHLLACVQPVNLLNYYTYDIT